MDQQYESLQKQAEELEHTVRDVIKDIDSPDARSLLSSATQIVTDLKVKKNPRSIEGSARELMQFLQQIRSGGEQVVGFSHADLLQNSYQNFIMELKKFDNY